MFNIPTIYLKNCVGFVNNTVKLLQRFERFRLQQDGGIRHYQHQDKKISQVLKSNARNLKREFF